MKSCATCAYWQKILVRPLDPDSASGCGECRRNPPTVPWGSVQRMTDLYDPGYGLFPMIEEDAWCGEYSNKGF